MNRLVIHLCYGWLCCGWLCVGWVAVGTPAEVGAAAEWREEPVPGPWSEATARSVAMAGGVGWYRAWLLPHASCFGKTPADLASESVGLHLSGLAGRHQIFLNGRGIGTGEGPGLHRHRIPPGTLEPGVWNEIAIRVERPDDPRVAGGFTAESPFVTSYFHECTLAGKWQFAAGDEAGRAGGALSERPGAAAFDRFTESSRVLGRAAQVPGPRLPPATTLERMRPAPGYAVDLVLHEPLLAQPFHASFDERGRLWVTQSRQYPYPAGVRMISRDKYYRSHYDRVPPPPPGHDRGADLISIHESTRRDGVYDRHSVYLDGLNMANAALRGRGGTWVMHTPYLLFYPDADGDGPDGDPEVRLAGFGLEDSHAIANGLAWGPDGWLYGAQGSTTSCRVQRPGLDDAASAAAFTGAMIWRYHPESRAFEIVAEGGGNTFGVEFDDEGRLTSGHNGGGTRGFHYVPGGLYRTPDVDPGKYGPPANPHAYGELPAMASTDTIPRFTHFGAFGLGTAMPRTAVFHLFALDPLHGLVTDTARQPRGSTFSTLDAVPALRCDDPAFRPIFITAAPDGGLMICDMYDYYVAHGQHYQNQIDPSTGRIWRLRGDGIPLEADTDLSRRSSPELVDLLAHDNAWHRRTALRLLGERKDPTVTVALASRVGSLDAREALHALWALTWSAGFDATAGRVRAEKHSGRSPAERLGPTALATTAITTAFVSPHAAVRSWAVRLVGDAFGIHRGPGVGVHAAYLGSRSPGRLPEELHAHLVRLARDDWDAEVLVQLAATARRLHREQAVKILAELIVRPGFRGDPYLPLMTWWAIESLYDGQDAAANEPLVALFEQRLGKEPGDAQGSRREETMLPEVAGRLARRLAADGRREALVLAARLIRSALDAGVAATVLSGFEEAFRGRPMLSLPEELVTAIAATGGESLEMRLRRREPGALDAALAGLRDRDMPLPRRLALVRTLGEIAADDAIEPLLALAGDAGEPSADLRAAAIAALGGFSDSRVADRLAGLLPRSAGRERDAICVVLSTREDWSRRLLDAVDAGRIEADAVPEDVATRLRLSRSPALGSRARLILPERPVEAGSSRERTDRLREILAAGQGNPYAGEATFLARCAQCHRLFHKGGEVGPDLTTYQRDDLSTLARAILEPSAEIREGFRYEVIVMEDGRSFGGFFVEHDDTVARLRTVDGETLTLAVGEIAEREPLGRSLMPAGLLDGLDDQVLRDLFAYLRIRQPITR